MLTTILMLAAGVALLYYGAEFLIKGGVSIALRLGVTPLVIGLTLVAFATSAPELVVSVQAALTGSGDIAIGNVVGSNICNIALILGISAVIAPLPVHWRVLKFDMPILIGVTLVFAAIGLGMGGFNRISGILFFAGLLAYVVWNVRSGKKEPDEAQEAEAEMPKKTLGTPWAVLLVLLGLGALVLGGKLMVDGAVELGRMAGLSEAVIGLTIVAVGTSLPELATSIVAAVRGHMDIAVGNVVGSNVFNILGIMGIAPLIHPMSVSGITWVDWSVMIFATLLLYPFMLSGKKVIRAEGAALLAIYVGYIAWLVVSA